MAVWKIERRKADCAGPTCGRIFDEGDRHISCLLLRDGEFVREDLCLDCWKARGAALTAQASAQQALPETSEALEAPQAAEATEVAEVAEVAEASVQPSEGSVEEIFWWRTRHQGSKKRSVQLDLASLERLFIQLEGREDRKVRELRYVLCLLLMRKRRVKVMKIERSPEGESFLVKRPRIDQLYRVWVFDFDAERMEEVRAQLQAIFDGAETDAGLPEDSLQDEPASQPQPGSQDPLDEWESDEPRPQPFGADQADDPVDEDQSAMQLESAEESTRKATVEAGAGTDEASRASGPSGE